MTAAAPRPGFARALLDDLRDIWWMYLVVPVALTAFSLGGWGSDLLAVFLLNLCATVAIGVTTQAVFVLGERVELRLPWSLHYPLFVIIGVALGTEIALVALRTFATFDPMALRRGLWLIGGIVAAIVAAISISYEHLRAHARAVELREEQAQRQALQAKLDALTARMNPHFLFNSLNTVAALIEEDPEAAVTAIERLGALLRYTLERDGEALVPLTDELDCVHGYLELQRARFGARLCIESDIEPGLEHHMIPPLTIQPLVENAIEHGVAHSRTPVTIRISARCEGDALAIEIRDDGPGNSASSGTGLAQHTIAARLRLLYGERGLLLAGPLPDRGYRAELRMPGPS